MTENKTSKAQLEANRRWEQKNRKKTTIDGYRRTARMFIRNHAELDDLEQLEKLINEKREQLTK